MKAFHNKRLKSTTIHEDSCSTAAPWRIKKDTKIGTWQTGTRKEIMEEVKRLGHAFKDHTACSK